MSLIDQLRKTYGKNECAREILLKIFNKEKIVDNFFEFQELIYDKIINNELFRTYQPSDKYLKLFLKTIISLVEEINEEVHPAILESYINLINSNELKDKYFITFFYNDKSPIIIEQYESVISNGTTGLHIWPACTHLLDFLEKNQKFIQNK
jgi:hypothetical protein